MADPLKLLQDYAMGRREIRELTHNGELYYVFNDVAYQKDAKTNLSVYNKPDEYYSIESILHFWKSRDANHTAYVKEVSGKGEKPSLPNANVLAPIPTPIPVTRLMSMHAGEEPERKKMKIEQEDKGLRIDKILDQSTDKPDVAEVRALSSELPAEKIALLRSRVKKNIKNTVKPVDDESRYPVDADISNASADSVGKHLNNKERTWKNRVTCLESQSKDFNTVLAVLSNLKTRDTNAQRPKPVPNADSASRQNPTTAPQNGKMMRSTVNTGYSRYDQEIFQKDPLADFQIETGLSFHGTSFRNAPKIMAGSQRQPDAVPSSSAREPPNGVSAHNQRPTMTIAQQRMQPQKRVSRTPIIIIPATGTALITMYNAVDILQDLKFVSTEEKKRQKSKRENEVLIQRHKETGTVPYRVIDNPLRLKDEEWDRVVAVFVQGPAWQFKDWKWGGNPVEIFSNVAAFHLKFDDQKIDANVARWSVHVLPLSKSKRHLDRVICH
ncbi:parafibromin [Ditylenchus destructor]|uniref:Parafibromin n=1 Tax=Ditylenchus destructor TaxID=166010 RepID=A0AAD4NDP1_9BILA|nr:parafibromin [Ditylenchus destructor]